MEKPFDMAVENLLAALDKTPRTNWRPAIIMTLQGVRELGHAEGFRAGNMTLEKPLANDTGLEDDLGAAAGYAGGEGGGALPLGSGGEDRALADEKRTQVEKDEDTGYEFIREIARAFGFMAREYDITASAIQIAPCKPDSLGDGQTRAEIRIFIKNPTMKGL